LPIKDLPNRRDATAPATTPNGPGPRRPAWRVAGGVQNSYAQQVLDVQTDAWGIKVSNVEIKHVDLNESTVRVIAKQAEAEREHRAKIIHAEGELQASDKLLEAAHKLAQAPQAMQLRYLQTLTAIAGEKSSTIIFPMPIDLISSVMDGLAKVHKPTDAG
jgi:regulator of protease activity HflC (stomatin/prohibitin superfamily)